ncbi:MAG: phosphatase PAP2 family protein [Armatimonadota bacterium]|jgi:undecaprenyl-diphosphatase
MTCALAVLDIQSIRDLIAFYDESVFRAINLGLGAGWLDPIMVGFTYLGIGATQVGIGLGALLTGLAVKKPLLRTAGYSVLVACLMALLFSQIGKFMCDRPRPPLLLFDIRLPDGPRFVHSFPSGHTTVTFAAAVVWAAFAVRLRWIIFVAAGLVGLSRVYLGVHFPFDVLYGAVLGIVCGKLSLLMFKPKAESSPCDNAE